MQAHNDTYALAILGAGPAGLTAGMYAGYAKLDTIIFESFENISLLATAGQVRNYPGMPEGIRGPELLGQMRKQVRLRH